MRKISSLKSRISEREFQAQVIRMAEFLGYYCYHVSNVKGQLKTHTSIGFPDLVLCGNGRLLFRELKVRGNQPTKAQSEWLRRLIEAGHDADIWRPSDWRKIERELKSRI